MVFDRGLISAQRVHLLALDMKKSRALNPEMESKMK